MELDLNRLSLLVERLRMEAIGAPGWVESKGVFEYTSQSVEVAVVLKIVRAAQGLHALYLLCREGLFVDMGAIYRCVGDCEAEIYFLLEEYPRQSSNVQKFLKEFFSKTIDGYLTTNEEALQGKPRFKRNVRRTITHGTQHTFLGEDLSLRVRPPDRSTCGSPGAQAASHDEGNRHLARSRGCG